MRIDRLEQVGPLAGGATPPRTGADLHTRDFAASLDALLSPEGGEAPAPAEAAEEAEVGGIRFSRHALARLDSRGIALDPAEMAELEGAVDQLAERGAKESLVLLGERAFVVGVPRRTVITAMPRQEALGTVFTNIDSTYVA